MRALACRRHVHECVCSTLPAIPGARHLSSPSGSTVDEAETDPLSQAPKALSWQVDPWVLTTRMKSWPPPPTGPTLCFFLSILSKHLACECLWRMGSPNPPQGIGFLPTPPHPIMPALSITVSGLPRSKQRPTPRPACTKLAWSPGRNLPLPVLTELRKCAPGSFPSLTKKCPKPFTGAPASLSGHSPEAPPLAWRVQSTH